MRININEPDRHYFWRVTWCPFDTGHSVNGYWKIVTRRNITFCERNNTIHNTKTAINARNPDKFLTTSELRHLIARADLVIDHDMTLSISKNVITLFVQTHMFRESRTRYRATPITLCDSPCRRDFWLHHGRRQGDELVTYYCRSQISRCLNHLPLVPHTCICVSESAAH